jgi:hypothetical protein
MPSTVWPDWAVPLDRYAIVLMTSPTNKPAKRTYQAQEIWSSSFSQPRSASMFVNNAVVTQSVIQQWHQRLLSIVVMLSVRLQQRSPWLVLHGWLRLRQPSIVASIAVVARPYWSTRTNSWSPAHSRLRIELTSRHARPWRPMDQCLRPNDFAYYVQWLRDRWESLATISCRECFWALSVPVIEWHIAYFSHWLCWSPMQTRPNVNPLTYSSLTHTHTHTQTITGSNTRL